MFDAYALFTSIWFKRTIEQRLFRMNRFYSIPTYAAGAITAQAALMWTTLLIRVRPGRG